MEGAGKVSARNWGGGGLNIFFRGRNARQAVLQFTGINYMVVMKLVTAIKFLGSNTVINAAPMVRTLEPPFFLFSPGDSRQKTKL